jgi:hypothetical protein
MHPTDKNPQITAMFDATGAALGEVADSLTALFDAVGVALFYLQSLDANPQIALGAVTDAIAGMMM